MATQLKFAFLVCLLLFILMEEAKPSQAKKGGGKFKKLADRVKKLEESMEVEDECKACSLIDQLTERLNAVEKEVEELKKPPPTTPAPPTTIPPPVTTSLPALECGSYQELTEADRKNTYGMGNAACDNGINPGWYRFNGAAGAKMATSAPNKNMCGTHAPGWLNGAHPSVAEGQVTRQVCFHWEANNCLWSTNIEVRNCGPFYIYKLKVPPGCQLRYCGSD